MHLNMKILGTIILVSVISACATRIKIESDVTTVTKWSSNIYGHLAFPEGSGPFPAVVLMHGCDGLSTLVKRGLQNHARYLRDNGYATMILDSFSSRGKNGGSVCTSYTELGSARFYRTFDAFNTLEYLKSQELIDANNVFLYGLSNGGSVALLVARGGERYAFPESLRYSAIAAFYPWCGMEIGPLASPLIVQSGELDDWTPPHGCEFQVGKVKGGEYKVIVYPDSHHSFDLPVPLQTFAGHTVGGNSESRDAAREAMVKFFNKYLK